MTSISQRDHDELIAALEKEQAEIAASPEAARKFLVRMGFGNYCNGSKGEVNDVDTFTPCTCKFCDGARKRDYNNALKYSRLLN